MTTVPPHCTPFAAIVRQFAPLLARGRDLYVAPNIPEKKLQGALKSYGGGVRPETVLALHDATKLGSASEGFLITTASLYLHPRNDVPRAVRFISITYLSSEPLTNAKGVQTGQWGTRVHMPNNTVDIAPDEIPPDALQPFLVEVQRAVQQGIVDSMDGLIPVQDMPDVAKVDYVLAIVLLALQNDGIIDPVEMQEIQLLMSRLQFSPSLRAAARIFMSAPTSTIEQVLDRLVAGVPRGTERAIQFSLLKDVIQVYRRTRPNSDTYSDPFVQFIAYRFGITRDQVTLIVNACNFDADVLGGEVADDVLMGRAKQLAALAPAVGVPMAAVWVSGSVGGLSAASMTSGLAALGFGGVLGFSSMFTGIGAAVLLGIGVHKGVQHLANRGENESKRAREALKQEVLRVHQTTINNLIDDVSQIASDIVDLQRQPDIDRARLMKLSGELSLFIRAMKGLRDKGTS